MKQKILDLIIAAKRDDPEAGSFAEWLAEHLVEHGVTVQRWIPVEEQRPKEEEQVLCINAKGNMFVAVPHPSINDAFYLPDLRYTCDGFRRATHWMPLPETPGKDGV